MTDMQSQHPKVRRAVIPIHHDRPRLDEVQAYMPHNYVARIVPQMEHMTTPQILIEGVDDHGWTLDDYVIPRLASGLITAREIS